jgi:hypothetical protein
VISFNHGQLLKIDYESDYNAVRRFLICNPGFNRRHFKGLLDNLPETITKYAKEPRLSTDIDFPIMVKGIQSLPKNYWENPWLRRSSWFSGAYNSVSANGQCPLCASIAFHSHVYSTVWFDKCPIHNEEITSHCPECGKRWHNLSNLLAENKCPTCGRQNLTSVLQKRKKNPKIVKQIANILEHAWQWKISTNKAISILFEDHGPLNKPSNCVGYNSNIYPRIIGILNSKEYGLIEKISDTIPALSCIEIPCSFDQITESNGFGQTTYTSIVEDELGILLSYLDQYKRNELDELGNAYFYYGIPYGFEVIKLAKVVFFSIVFKQILKGDKKNQDEWIEKIYSKIRMPTPYFNHRPLAIVSNNDKCHMAVPNKLSEWYVRTSIRNLFLYIYKTVGVLKIINSAQLSAEMVRDKMADKIGEWSQECARYYLRKKGNKLLLLHEKSPSWGDILNCPSLWDPPFPVPGYGYR